MHHTAQQYSGHGQGLCGSLWSGARRPRAGRLRTAWKNTLKATRRPRQASTARPSTQNLDGIPTIRQAFRPFCGPGRPARKRAPGFAFILTQEEEDDDREIDPSRRPLPRRRLPPSARIPIEHAAPTAEDSGHPSGGWDPSGGWGGHWRPIEIRGIETTPKSKSASESRFWDGDYGGGVRVGRPFGARWLAPLRGGAGTRCP